MQLIDSIALFGTYCICFTNVLISNRMKRVIENKDLIYISKSKDRTKKVF